VLWGVPELLPRFLRHQQALEDAKKLSAILLKGDEVENEAGMPLRRSADGHNRDRARGIPIVGRNGGGGASPGTDPVAALRRKDAGRVRQAAGSSSGGALVLVCACHEQNRKQIHDKYKGHRSEDEIHGRDLTR
jgi:hypothetical protein